MVLAGLVNVDRKRGIESYLHWHALPQNFIVPASMGVDFVFCWAADGNRPLSCPIYYLSYSALEIRAVPTKNPSSRLSWGELSFYLQCQFHYPSSCYGHFWNWKLLVQNGTIARLRSPRRVSKKWLVGDARGRSARLDGRLLAVHIGKLTTTPLSLSFDFGTFYCFRNPSNRSTAKQYGPFNKSGTEYYRYRPCTQF